MKSYLYIISLLYWQIGKRINEEILQNQRAEYGKEIVSALSEQLTIDYGSGWSKRQLHHCIRFAEVFPDFEIVHTLCSQLSWSHLRLIIPIVELDLIQNREANKVFDFNSKHR